MDNKHLFSIILVVFIDLLGFSLILPLLQYYAKTFNANQTTTGILIASYAVMQLIGAPILGRLSDRFGRRPILLLSVFGTFLGFLLLGFANTLWMLFASRIIDGLTGGNLSVAQAYISDITDEKNRSKGLGMIVASFLVKDLLIDWRWGKAWFMENLVDGDLAANNGGWQWTAGTGTDAAPYFRIFNPVLQSTKFNPNRNYIREWVPELRKLNAKDLHAPWEKYIKIKGYPEKPIVDHAIVKERTLKAYSLSKTKG
jgi:MFS family permease